MKLITILLLFLLVLGVGGFVWLAVSDAPLRQKEVVKEIPYERFSDTP